jgi:hypothetical protein
MRNDDRMMIFGWAVYHLHEEMENQYYKMHTRCW